MMPDEVVADFRRFSLAVVKATWPLADEEIAAQQINDASVAIVKTSVINLLIEMIFLLFILDSPYLSIISACTDNRTVLGYEPTIISI